MKIAIFHELSRFSGARKMVNEYGKILSKDNKVDIFYVDEYEDKDIKSFFTNINFFRFEDKKWKGNNIKVRLYKDTVELLMIYLLHRRIAKQINSGKYDLILINPSKFTQAPFLLRFTKKNVYFCQEPLRIVYDDLYKIAEIKNIKDIYETVNRSLRKLIDKSNIKRAKIVLANSRYSKENIKSAYGVNSLVCYLGVDEKSYLPSNSKKTYDIYFTGEKELIEGYDLFKETLNLYNRKLKVTYSNRHGSRGLSEKEMAKQYNNSKIALCLSKNEPFGLSPLEAMSCGVPVVAVKEGGLKETVVNGKTGYLVKRDTKELKAKIDLLLSDDKLRKNMGLTARNHILSNFTWEKSVESFLKILKYD